MSFSEPPRRVPATVLFDRITVLIVVFFVVFFGQVLFIRGGPPFAKYVTLGTGVAILIIYGIAILVNSKKYLVLLRNGEIVNARIVSCRINYERQWFPVEDFAQHWQPYHSPPSTREGASAFDVTAVVCECEFEFRVRGNVVRGRDKMKMATGTAERAVEPVIFLPSNPVVCRFVHGLPIAMQIQLTAQ